MKKFLLAFAITIAVVVIFVVVILAVVTYPRGARQETVRTAQPTSVPRTVFLSCSECAEEGMLINLWSKPGGLAEGAQTVKSLPHGTRCKEIGKEGDFIQVICKGYRGWVKITLVNR